MNDQGWLDAIHEALCEAVRKRNEVADVPVGVLLSGGLDFDRDHEEFLCMVTMIVGNGQVTISEIGEISMICRQLQSRCQMLFESRCVRCQKQVAPVHEPNNF